MRRRPVGTRWEVARVLAGAVAVCGPWAAPARAQQPLVADASVAEPDETSQLEELLRIVEEETEIATRTRMNGDFVPGIVTVLQGEEMEALGFETVWDALRMVPGVMVERDRPGAPSVQMRGLHFGFNSGNVKVLLDGLPLSREDAGVNGLVLDTPLALVERIEVIRGPGSVVYGDFAFLGLVNIVTRREGTRVFAEGSTEDSFTGGLSASFGTASGWHGSLSGAGQYADPALVTEPRSGSENRSWAVLGLGYAGFSLDAAFAHRDVDDPGVARSRIDQTHRHATLEARWERELRPSLTSVLYGGYRHNHIDQPGTTLDGQVANAGWSLRWEGWQRHAWLVDLSWSRSHIDDATHLSGPLPVSQLPVGPAEVGIGGLRDIDRTILSATLQDALDVSDDVTLTVGGRLDRYDDLGTRVTPRAALVWRLSPRNILKAQYAESFRPPTFFEQFDGGVDNPDIGFEVNATAELNYVNRTPGHVLRATLFRSELRDGIFPGPEGFANLGTRSAQGVELEWQQELGSRVKASGNVSFVDAEDSLPPDGTANPSPAAADWLYNLALSVRARRDTLLAARWSHVGDLNTPEVGGYDVVDVTLTQKLAAVPGLQLRLGVKNLFDDEVVFASVLPRRLDPLPFGGRAAWLQVTWDR